MVKFARYAGQVIAYAAFIAFIGYFSRSPAHVAAQPGDAEIKLSFSHAGQLKQPCRQRSEEELKQLAPNMRVAMDCPRERSPVQVELELDGKPLYQAVLPPAGLARDGMSSMYRRFPVGSGRHTLRAKLRDREALADFNYSKNVDITLAAGQVFVIGFDARQGGFVSR